MYKIGSKYFFEGLEGFKPHDEDYLAFVENPKEFKNVRQVRLHNSRCEFYWRKMDKNEFIEYSLHNGPAMQVGKFLVKEIAEELKMTIEDLKKLQPLIDNLDDKHKYEKIIFECYIENNKFELTKEQLLLAFEEYKKYR